MPSLYLTDGTHSRSVSLAANSTEVEITPGDNLSRNTKQKMQLKRELGLFSAVNLIVGVMIGTACSGSQLSDINTPFWLMCNLIIFPEYDDQL
jgi:hypothetical protein